MKKAFFTLAILTGIYLQAQTGISGQVYNQQTGEPLIGATVVIEGSFLGTSTDLNGKFILNGINTSPLSLVTSYIGYKRDTISVEASSNKPIEIYLTPLSYYTDMVIISGTRVQKDAPATVSNLLKTDLEKVNLGQDLPYLLQNTPSVVTTSDAGTGIGYTGLRIRGSDASRINVTINGIPLNDPESHGVFWVNMPDFASSLNSVQIQRGVGTSTNGPGAFGATVNLETNQLTPKPYGEINNSVGFLEQNKKFKSIEYNSRKHTVNFGSGLFNDKFSIEGRLSNIQSDGYIDRATADLKSYFLSAGYYSDKTVLKAITFGGKERTYQSWYGTPQVKLEEDAAGIETYIINNGLDEEEANNLRNSGRSYNFYTYDNQVDNYEQNHYQLHFSHAVSSVFQVNASLHYTKGFGYFEEFKKDESFSDYNLANPIIGNDTLTSTDLVRRRWLDNDFYGMVYSISYDINSQLKTILGGGINQYQGDHFGEIIWSEFSSTNELGDQYYFSESYKFDGNTYLKTSYNFNSKLNFYTDLQIRVIKYQAAGTDNDLRSFKVDENYTFFNPKIGANYKHNSNVSAYIFGGIANREPNRADFTDQPANTPKKDANKPERLYNIEIGSELKYSTWAISGNLFGMFYKDQLVNTGQLNDVGSPLRQNVDESYRVGIELQAKSKLTEQLSLNFNGTYSKNKIKEFNEILYDYTNGFEVLTTQLKHTDIALSPEIIITNEFIYQPNKNLELAFITRYVGDQYLDNTSNENSKIEAYLVNDLRLAATLPQKLFKEVKVQLLVNNIFNEEYSSNGYTFSYIFGTKVTENFYYPQSFRNYLIGLNVKF